MKTSTKILLTIVLATVLAGCSAQKSAMKTAVSKAAYSQALDALEQGKFDIEAREFRYTSGKRNPVISNNSYVSVRPDQATADFGYDIYGHSFIVDFSIYNGSAVLTQEKDARNGDPQYTLLIKDASGMGEIRMLVRLYKNTNECFVKVYYYINKNPYNFTGYIYPADTQKIPVRTTVPTPDSK